MSSGFSQKALRNFHLEDKAESHFQQGHQASGVQHAGLRLKLSEISTYHH